MKKIIISAVLLMSFLSPLAWGDALEITEKLEGWKITKDKDSRIYTAQEEKIKDRYVVFENPEQVSTSISREIKVVPHGFYRVTFMARFDKEAEGKRGRLIEVVFDGMRAYPGGKGTKEDETYSRYEVFFSSQQAKTVNFSIGPYVLKGKACIADIAVERIAEHDQTLSCLTGNCPGGTSNIEISATYQYYEGLTDANIFPRTPLYHETTDGDNGFYYGPIPISRGFLTDKQLSGANHVTFSSVFCRSEGKDVEFDLGRDFQIEEVELWGDSINGGRLYLRQDGKTQYVKAAALPGAEGPRSYGGFHGFSCPARFIRVNIKESGGQLKVNEVRIWGRKEIKEASLTENINPDEPHLTLGVPLETNKACVSEKNETVFILPQPQEMSVQGKPFIINDKTKLVIAKKESQTYRTALLVKEELKAKFNLELPVLSLEGKGQVPEDSILLAEADDKIIESVVKVPEKTATPHSASSGQVERGHPPPWKTPWFQQWKDALRRVRRTFAISSIDKTASDKLNITTASPGPEGYGLLVNPTGIIIIGSDAAGTFYGCMSLLQILRTGENGVEAPGLMIRDWPDMKFRWMMVDIRNEFGLRLIKMLTRFKMNVGIGGLDIPGINAETRQFLQDHFVTVSVPITSGIFVNAAKHSGRLSVVELKKGESLKELKSDARACPCPSNPDTYKFIEETIDRTRELYPQMKYVSLNMDEMHLTSMGARWNACELCKARKMTNAELLEDYVRKVHGIAKKRGLGVIFSSTPQRHYAAAYTNLPKDIVMWDYYNRACNEVPALGYTTIGGFTGMFFPEPFPQNLGGFWIWNWSDTSEESMMNQMLTILTAAEQGWTNGKPPLENPAGYSRLVRGMAMLKEGLKGYAYPSLRNNKKECFTVNLAPYGNMVLDDWTAANIPSGRFSFQGIPFEIAVSNGQGKGITLHNRGYIFKTKPSQTAGIRVKEKAAGLIFLHTAVGELLPTWFRGESLIGYYNINYADGTFVRADIRYLKNICKWDREYGYGKEGMPKNLLYEALPAWQGIVKDGKNVTFYAYEWVNPYPEKEIASIDFCCTNKKRAVHPVLFGITGIKPTALDKGREEKVCLATEKNISRETDMRGRALNWVGGTTESGVKAGWQYRENKPAKYVAPDGTIVETPSIWGHSVEPNLMNMFYDNDAGWSGLTGKGKEYIDIDIAMMEEKNITGFAVCGMYEQPRFAFVRPVGYEILGSKNKNDWKALAKRTETIGDYDGIVYHSIEPEKLKYIRVRIHPRFHKPARANCGLSFFQVYEQR